MLLSATYGDALLCYAITWLRHYFHYLQREANNQLAEAVNLLARVNDTATGTMAEMATLFHPIRHSVIDFLFYFRSVRRRDMAGELSQDEVASYLRSHPGFLADYVANQVRSDTIERWLSRSRRQENGETSSTQFNVQRPAEPIGTSRYVRQKSSLTKGKVNYSLLRIAVIIK